MLGANLPGVYDAVVQAMLLAAGLGTRLQPLTDVLPKPVVPVANRPLAAFGMGHLGRAGVRSIIANTHPRPEIVQDALRRHCPAGVDLAFSHEATLLGTGGGLRRAHTRFPDPTSPVIVMNGDTLFAPDVQRAYRRHVEEGALATMILRRTPEPARFGAIGVDGDGRVTTLLGTPTGRKEARTLMFTGVHILAPEAFADMPESGCVIRTAYRRWVDTGAPVLGVIDDSPWADLGTVADYHQVNLELASGVRRWPGIVPIDGSLFETGAPADHSQIRNSVVGAGVRIEAGVSIDRCVVWPDSVIARSASRAVITPEHRIELS